jgi:glycerol dehydrogenase
MTDILLSPKRYVQGEGILKKVQDYLKPFGRRPLILSDELVFSIVRPEMEYQLLEAEFHPSFALIGEECSHGEVARLENMNRDNRIEFIVGIGGGTSIDTSRALAEKMNVSFVAVPTSAATCSATSSVAVMYDKGIWVGSIYSKSADLVLADTGIISKAPVNLLAAGMGDALAKWYEGKLTYDQVSDHNLTTQTAMILSTQTRNAIMALGLEAKRDVESKKNSLAIEKIVEANLLLTGVISCFGGTMFRIAVAHYLLYGLMVLPQVHRNLHGEMVSFGIVVQLCLEKNEKELEVILPFFAKIGLPLTLEELGLENMEDPLFGEGLKYTCAKVNAIQHMPFIIDEKILNRAICEANDRGKAERQKMC